MGINYLLLNLWSSDQDYNYSLSMYLVVDSLWPHPKILSPADQLMSVPNSTRNNYDTRGR